MGSSFLIIRRRMRGDAATTSALAKRAVRPAAANLFTRLAMPDATPSPEAAGRNLLIGFLALQMDFINYDALVAEINAWVLKKSEPLGRILLEQRVLSPDDAELLTGSWAHV
jgi:hypothetical protein